MDLSWTNDAGELEAIVFDATPREVIHAGAEATQHPLETGASVTDHVIPTIVKASFDCFVSDSPSGVPVTQMFGVQGSVRAAQLDGGAVSVFARGAQKGQGATFNRERLSFSARVLQFDAPFSRRERVYEQLELLRLGKTILTATCMLKQLDQVVITDLSVPLDARSGDGVVFGIELTQVRFAETQIVSVPVPAEPRGAPPQDGGTLTPNPADATTVSTARGLLEQFGILGSSSGVVGFGA